MKSKSSWTQPPAASLVTHPVLDAGTSSQLDDSTLSSVTAQSIGRSNFEIPTITVTDCSEPAYDFPELCLLCDSPDHVTYSCPITTSGSNKGYITARKRGLCYLCLSSGYNQSHCCIPYNVCLAPLCHIKPLHSSALCGSSSPDSFGGFMFSSTKQKPFVINRLQTLILWFFDPVNKVFEPVRCLADTGASHSFLEAKKAETLNLSVLETKRMCISSFANHAWPRVGVVQVTAQGSVDPGAESLKATFLTVANLCSVEISSDLSTEQWESVKNLKVKLADPQATQNGVLPIEAIIGQDLYYSLVDGASLLLPGGLRLVHTVFDTYMLAGSSEYQADPVASSGGMINLSSVKPGSAKGHICQVSHSSGFAAFDTLTSEEEQYNLDRFSRLDILGISPEEDIHPVMDHFEKSVKYVDGRFEVELPKKYPQLQKLQSNFFQSFSRTVGGMKKRAKNPDKTEFNTYNKSITEYIAKGILEKVAVLGTIEQVKRQLTENPHAFDRIGVTSEDTAVCYLPHFPQYKASSGKLRVVYDAKSRPCKGALSLNECLDKGPDLMNALIRILLRFRKGKYAAKADIEKAFLQVGICPKDRDLLRIVWIVDGEVLIYRFTRLPFGLNCSPFLLAAVMHRTLFGSDMDEETRDQIISSFYVDDSVYSEKTLDLLMHKKSTSTEAFKQAGMPLREWNSNDPEARKSFSKVENRELPEDETVLGLFWDLRSDTIGVNHRRVLNLMGKVPKTKRSLWSFVHSLYDPLGLIAPYTIQAKFLTSEVSKHVKGWDSKIPIELAQKVTVWMEDFDNLESFRLPRCTELENPVWKKLVGFCDASSKGIAACIYVVSYNGEQTMSHLVKANTHIPKEQLKTKIPRLELIGAVMLATLMTEVRKAYPEVSLEHIHYFTDSADVLYWIYSGASHWDVFVANRICSIRQLTEVNKWHHVSSAENPADIPSRGCSLGKLKDMDLWKYGPEFLKEDMVDHKSTLKGYDAVHTMEIPSGCLAEMRSRVNLVSSTCGQDSLSPHILISKVMNVNEYGSYHKLITVTAILLEFLNKLDIRRQVRLSKPSLLKQIGMDCTNSTRVRSEAELLWIRATQVTHFPGIQLLVRNPDAKVGPSVRSVFFQHGIFLDPKSQVLCCTTRMQNSDLPPTTVFPMLIPSHSTFTNLYIRHVHELVGHQGVAQTLTYIRKEFWLPKGRKAAQTILRQCNKCRKVEGKSFPLPPHPPLPDFRTKRSPAFSATGLDFTGPFKVRDVDGKLIKVYVLLLTCALTRCVHLEVTRSLGIKDCIMALERFYSFRGIPQHLESDNGSSFIRCNRELKFVLKSRRAQRYFDQSKINWNFYTSNSPHMGGFIEKLNDIFKRTSRKTFGKTSLMDFEEFRTMIHYSMAVMNDRPITYVYFGDSSDGVSLSPNKMVIGHDVLEPPHIRFEATKDEISKKYGVRFSELEKIKDEYWKQWNDQYLTELYERHIRSNKTSPHLLVPKLGDVCLLKRKTAPRRKWKLCRVIGFKKPKRDSHIRQCRVKTLTDTGKPSVLNRSPQFLIPLEVQPHAVTEEPLIKTYVQPDIIEPPGSEPQISQPLPPFWSQPIKLPPNVYDISGKSKKKGKGRFRSKGKFPLPVKKKAGRRKKGVKKGVVRVSNVPSGTRSSVTKPSVSGDDSVPADPTWKPAAKKKTEVPASTRILRSRHPGGGTSLV